MFEIKARDAGGRIGRLNYNGRSIETPIVLPVISPRSQLIPPEEIRELGFEGVITNSYIIYKDGLLREKALKEGMHSLIGFDGLVMTDSGSYQLYQYGDVEVGSQEIVDFQRAIKSDIGVILDIPTPPDVKRSRAEADLRETLERANESVARKGDMLLAGTVQGSTYMDLREKSAREVGQLDFDIHPIGGVVPVMENYRYDDLARIIIHSKKFLPPERPVHLFGAGHPMMLSLAVALGCDFFDSAAYYLYARDKRYITELGTFKVDQLHELPCQCPVCQAHQVKDLKAGSEGFRLLALHNLYATIREIRVIKNAIYSGSLWELVESRCRSHPRLLDALRTLKDYHLEDVEPLSKSTAFFYSGPESLHRPEVKGHLKRLKNLKYQASKCVLLPHSPGIWQKDRPGSNKEYQVSYVSWVFGIIPSEVEEVYPLAQHEAPALLDEDQRQMVRQAVKEHIADFDEVFATFELDHPGFERWENDLELPRPDDTIKMMGLGDYQFGAGAGEILFKDCHARYSRTGRLRHILKKGKVFAAVRAADGIIVPSRECAERLLKLPFPLNRVVVEDAEAGRYIKEGKSVFTKFIVDSDPMILPGSEVVVVDRDDELLGWGRTTMGGKELIAFKKGVGVKTRGSLKD